MRQAKEEEQADIEEFDEDTVDKGDDTVRYAHSNNIVLYYFCGQILLYFKYHIHNTDHKLSNIS